MSIATGGKVWRVPTGHEDAMTPKPFYHTVKMPLLVLTPIWLGVVYFSFWAGKNFFSYEVLQHPVFDNEYNAEVAFSANVHYIYGIVLLTAGLSFGALKIAKRPKVNLSGFTALMHLSTAGMCIAFIVAIAGGVFFHPVKPTPFEDWAKATHGYSSMIKVENSDKLVYDAINADGENVRVKVYENGPSKYLYENNEQLKVVLDKVSVKTIAQEEASPK